MTKYKKLALSPSGEIVNRSTGRLVRAKGLTVRSNRVYDKNGRLYGYLGKQTKKEREKTEKLDTQRQKKRAYTAKKKQSQITPKTKTTTNKKDIIDSIFTPTPYPNESIIDESLIDETEIELDINEPKPISEESLLLITDIDRWMKFVESDERVLPNYKRIKQEEANFARSVNGRVDDENHKLSYDEGEKLKQKWKEATTDEERTEVWNELKKMDPNKGYSYDPEVMTTS